MNEYHATPVHPGHVLQDELEELGLTQTELAEHINVLPQTIGKICRGEQGLNALMSMKLSRALGASPQFWLNLQNNWEISQADESEYGSIQLIACSHPVAEDFLRSEAKQGKREDFERFLAKVPDIEPEAFDRL